MVLYEKNNGEINMCKNDKNCDCENKEVDEFMHEFHEHGIGCGNEIANIAKEIHHDAMIIIPLYRSCIVIEQSEKEKKEGVLTLHAYGDPHWKGREIDIETLKLDDFHVEFLIEGDRQCPIFINKSKKEDQLIIENDEN